MSFKKKVKKGAGKKRGRIHLNKCIRPLFLPAPFLLFWAGDADAAFEWLNRAIELSAVNVSGQFAEPYYLPMHDDPRWAQFLARTGRTPEQLDAIKFEVSLPRQDVGSE